MALPISARGPSRTAQGLTPSWQVETARRAHARVLRPGQASDLHRSCSHPISLEFHYTSIPNFKEFWEMQPNCVFRNGFDVQQS